MTQLRTDSPGRRKSFFGASAVRGAEGVRALVRLRIPTFSQDKDIQSFPIGNMLRCNNRKIASPAGAFRMRRRHCRQRCPGLLPPAAPAGMETTKRAGSPFRGAPGFACHIGLACRVGTGLPALLVISVCLPCRH